VSTYSAIALKIGSCLGDVHANLCFLLRLYVLRGEGGFWWRFGLVGNVVGRIIEVNQRRARLVLGRVTVFKTGKPSLYVTIRPGQLSLAIPPRVGKMSTGDDYGHRQGRNLPKVATQWNSGATRDSNTGLRARIPSALTTRPLSHTGLFTEWNLDIGDGRLGGIPHT